MRRIPSPAGFDYPATINLLPHFTVAEANEVDRRTKLGDYQCRMLKGTGKGEGHKFTFKHLEYLND